MGELRLEGRSAAIGFAAGPLAPIAESSGEARVAGAPDEEERRLRGALAAALRQLNELMERAAGDGADILAFQVAMLEDPELGAPAFAALEKGVIAEFRVGRRARR